MRQDDVLFWIWLSQALGAASSEFRKLIHVYESPYDIFEADSEELERLSVLRERTVAALSNKNLQEASEILDRCQRLGIGIMTYDSVLYPRSLREIANPPILLYYAGTVPSFDDTLFIGVVGTRKMSVYGMETAYKISYELAAGNAVTVSGLAAGIDGVCAAATIKAGGRTVAVLGCGLDRVYPAHHGKLMNAVAEKGLLLSEYPPGTKPLYYNFPVRNRIISGLSHAVIVVEAGLGSGSLITAKESILQGKDVFAVPANVNGAGSEGTNGLLRDGAYFAENAEDVAKRYTYLFPKSFFGERVREASKHSHPDSAYLVSMGVLEASAAASDAPDAERKNPMAQIPKSPRRTAKKDDPTVRMEKRAVQQENTLAPSSATDGEAVESERAPKPRKTPDAILQSRSPIQLELLQAIPDDQTITTDALGKLGHPYGEILTALTMLEIMGLVEKLPGAVYRKA